MSPDAGVHKLDTRTGLSSNPLATVKGFRLGVEGDDRAPVFLYLRMQPGQTAPRHAHAGWACTIVLAGSAQIGDHWLEVGELLLVEPGSEYGPVEPGSDGLTALEIFDSQVGIEQTWDESDTRVIAFRAGEPVPIAGPDVRTT